MTLGVALNDAEQKEFIAKMRAKVKRKRGAH
jgi:hypothetical protein